MTTAPRQSAAEVPSSKPEPRKIPGIVAASVPETLAALRVNPDTGLTHAEVDTRRKEHGYNEVAETKEHPILRFLSKFWGLSAWMLELIMVLSAVLHKFSDLAVVSALLIVNAVLSFAQERRAAGVVETLRKRLQVSARVRRDASWQVIPARELVPGDILRVRPGDIIPADTKLLSGELSVDQSALTGESKDADKAPGDALSSGSVVRRGEGNGVVMLTGAQTYFGRTTELVQKARPKLHIEAVVAKVVRWLFVIVGALLSVVVVLSLMRGTPLIEMVSLLLVLLMSAVPVALPVMFTVSMAVGAAELAKRGVLVTRLSAAEDAANEAGDDAGPGVDAGDDAGSTPDASSSSGGPCADFDDLDDFLPYLRRLALRHRKFFSLADANQAIGELLHRLNHRPFRKRDGSRTSVFEALDKPALQPLPQERFEISEWERARVNIDYHVAFDGNFYSVPYNLVHEAVEIRALKSTLEKIRKNLATATAARQAGAKRDPKSG